MWDNKMHLIVFEGSRKQIWEHKCVLGNMLPLRSKVLYINLFLWNFLSCVFAQLCPPGCHNVTTLALPPLWITHLLSFWFMYTTLCIPLTWHFVINKQVNMTDNKKKVLKSYCIPVSSTNDFTSKSIFLQ